MDGESLEALLGTTQGPDCLKELIPKVGIRLKVYQRIRTAMYNRCQIFSSVSHIRARTCICIVSSDKSVHTPSVILVKRCVVVITVCVYT